MLQRVQATHGKDHANYVQRGITVCERWLKFENFFADMGLRPSSKHSIDRKNNDGNYEPGNCRWATKEQQVHNTRDRYRNNTSGTKGVGWRRDREKWVAFISVRGKRKHLGTFKSRYLAIAARRRAQETLWEP